MAVPLGHQLADPNLVEAARDKLADQEWRLNNLYYIQDKRGKKVLFRMNWSQRLLFRGMWFLNIVLKARQLGMSTFIQLYMLDTCLFNSNTSALVIAHGQQEAKTMFRDKIKYAYDHLDPYIKSIVGARNDSANTLRFSNDSKIVVATSGRSGTYQIVHVSEFGKICAKYPERAREIVTGTFEAVEAGQMIFIESTAEGREGRFYEMCKAAKKQADAKQPLSKLDYKFWFFPWWKHPEYTLDPTNIVLFPYLKDYFTKLEAKLGIKLTMGQKAWYAKKSATLGSDIKREHPSTPEEAFEQVVEGAYYNRAMTKARQEGRVGKVPHTQGVVVDTFWDLGVNDTTAIWFVQTVGAAVHVIDYYENSGEGLQHYKDILDDKAREKGYRYGTHLWPHDGGKRELGTGLTLQQQAHNMGFFVEINPRGNLKEGIEITRNFISVCWFDEENCTQVLKYDTEEIQVGINSLESYRKEWDDKLGAWKQKPLHNWASNGADAFRTLATGHAATRVMKTGKKAKKEVKKVDSGGWT